jgi:hypothetical protein
MGVLGGKARLFAEPTGNHSRMGKTGVQSRRFANEAAIKLPLRRE